MTTRAVVFPAVDRFELRTLTLPDPGPEDMVVRTLVTAVSPGTERWILRGKHIGTTFPCVPGYHRIGVVESVGEAVRDVAVGTLVYGCGNRWEEKEVVSMWGAHVGLSVSPPAGYHVISTEMLPMEKLDCLAFAVLCGVSNRGINKVEPRAGDTTLHIGGGIVGTCAAQLARLRGASPVVLDKDPERIAYLTRAFPSLPVWSVDDPDLEAKLKEAAPGGFDMLQDTVGHAPTIDKLVPFVKGQGMLLLQAQYFDKAACAIDLDQIKIRELTVKTTCGVRQEDWEQTSENLLSGRLDMRSLITHEFPAERILEAYDMLHTGRPHAIGMVIHW